MSTGAVGRSQSEFKHHQAASGTGAICCRRNASGPRKRCLPKGGGAGLSVQVWSTSRWYLDRARVLVTQLAGVVAARGPQSAAASPSPELERARLTRPFRHALPPMVQLETGRGLEPSLLSLSVPQYLFNPRPEPGLLDPRAEGPGARCHHMRSHAWSWLVCQSSCQAVPQCWAPRLDGWKVIPSKTSPFPQWPRMPARIDILVSRSAATSESHVSPC